MVFARGWGKEKTGNCLMGVVSVLQDEKVWRLAYTTI
jgi:hypothetical protein